MNVTALRLRMLRKEKHLSQQNVADALGITRTAYNKYESGAIQPSRRIAALCDLYGVSADYILGKDGTVPAARPGDTHIEGQFRKYLGLSDTRRGIVDITLDAVYQIEQKKQPESAS